MYSVWRDTACAKRNNGVSLSLSLITATRLATTRSISPVVSPRAFCKGFLRCSRDFIVSRRFVNVRTPSLVDSQVLVFESLMRPNDKRPR